MGRLQKAISWMQMNGYFGLNNTQSQKCLGYMHLELATVLDNGRV